MSHTVSAVGRYEPYMMLQVLRGCPKCHTPHPAALGLSCIDVCSNCGEASIPPGEVINVEDVTLGEGAVL